MTAVLEWMQGMSPMTQALVGTLFTWRKRTLARFHDGVRLVQALRELGQQPISIAELTSEYKTRLLCARKVSFRHPRLQIEPACLAVLAFDDLRLRRVTADRESPHGY